MGYFKTHRPGLLSPKPMTHIEYIFPHYFHKIYKFPLFKQKLINIFTLYFRSIGDFLITVFGFPYFDLDAFTPHALHAQDAPACRLR